VFANVLLGISQGLTWSVSVIMKIDLVGARQRGLAMGLNEFAGYFAMAGSALATGWLAVSYGPRPEPFYLGVLYVALGLVLSIFVVRETRPFVALESRLNTVGDGPTESQRVLFNRVTWADRDLSSVTQIFTGWWSEHVGRKPLIVSGMLVQAVGIVGSPALRVTPNMSAAASHIAVGTPSRQAPRTDPGGRD
jgi:MFS family permease